MKLDPGLPALYKRLVIMGGAENGRGNTPTLTSEFNIYTDPEAAHIVFSNWPSLTMVSWEATMANSVPMDMIDRWQAMETPRSIFFSKVFANTLAFITAHLGRTSLPAADGLAMAVAIEPEIVQSADERYVTVELNGQHARGQTVVDWSGRSGLAPNTPDYRPGRSAPFPGTADPGHDMTLSGAEADRIARAARAYEPAVLAFLQDLVRLPSVNGRDTEAAVAGRIAAEAERLGLAAELIAADAERPNVLVSWGEGARGFALVGHMDTVAAGDENAWSVPPFAGVVRDGRLLGRGAADNKAGLACGLYTLALIRDLDLLDPAQVRLLLAGVVDEESGASSKLGVRYLLDQGRLRADGAIYTYTSDIICIGHRGLLRLALTARGQALHTGSPAWSRKEGGCQCRHRPGGDSPGPGESGHTCAQTSRLQRPFLHDHARHAVQRRRI